MDISIGMKIRELRSEVNMSQEELAKACNVKQSCVSKWERGTTFPPVDIIVTLAKLFKVTSDYLLGLEN